MAGSDSPDFAELAVHAWIVDRLMASMAESALMAWLDLVAQLGLVARLAEPAEPFSFLFNFYLFYIFKNSYLFHFSSVLLKIYFVMIRKMSSFY